MRRKLRRLRGCIPLPLDWMDYYSGASSSFDMMCARVFILTGSSFLIVNFTLFDAILIVCWLSVLVACVEIV